MNNTPSPVRRRRRRTLLNSLLALGLLCTAVASNAATATFSNIKSANYVSGSLIDSLFDQINTTASGNTLVIALRDFTATGVIGGLPGVATDTLLVDIAAPVGFYISSLTYREDYAWSAENGAVGVTLSITANDQLFASGSGEFGSSGHKFIQRTLNFGPGTGTVSLAVTNSLFAFSSGGLTSITKVTEDDEQIALLTIGLTEVPLPPALGLLGAALVGLATVSARRRI